MAEGKPNILLVMTDQQRADFLKRQGFGLDTMPFLESLGARGVWFDRAYTPMPICVPARISLLTGRYPKAHGMIANWSPYTSRHSEDLLDVLRASGYELALFGKNHTYAGEGDFHVWRPYMHTTGIPRPESAEEDAAFDSWMTGLAHWASESPTPFGVDSQYPSRIV